MGYKKQFDIIDWGNAQGYRERSVCVILLYIHPCIFKRTQTIVKYGFDTDGGFG